MCDVHAFWQCCYPGLWHLWITSSRCIVCEETLRPLTLHYLVPFDPLFLYFYDAADYSWFKISTVPVGFSSVHLSLLYPTLSPSCSSPLSTTNGRQPRCQFHARVVSSAAEIIYCKIDLNNHKVERRGKATEWNCESLLPFSVRSIAEEEFWCIAYSGDIEFFNIAVESKNIVYSCAELQYFYPWGIFTTKHAGICMFCTEWCLVYIHNSLNDPFTPKDVKP